MIVTRQELEAREEQTLAPYAMRNSASRGRRYPEDAHPYRLDFQRDRDRIIHTTAFRRLEYKTQVFVYSEGDHYRNRLTHSIEVAQIGRTLARALGCNEDLTEAICLAHDLGHPPFGHVGEETLNRLMEEHGGFDHQRQTYRILTEIERRYPDHPGLNLTYEVLEGVVKHDTDYDVVDARDYHPEERGTLECQLSNLADEIAYNTSDLDDGLRSGLLDPEQVKLLAIAQRTLDSLGLGQDADLRSDLVRYRFIRRLIGIEVSDVITATSRKLEEFAIDSVESLRKAAENVACYSPALAAENQELKQYLFQHFYRHHRVVRMAVKAARTLTQLFEAYINEPRQLPGEIQRRAASSPEGLHRVVCDYLAGMTDRYAIQEYRRLYDIEERA
ncbi:MULTISPECIES: deoxyguanosinetriphosphate triphosphohydrolase [Caldilinea]|jgi:dGTPase|uniref:Deoxyguanosinetriphosphate triphosphohydrolase-like protein n=1 Tax=Caldilinea aerophila (strain DSM 14535 / JCM 11387 / NBRC 104270 / STL-6-O1) TaxID=926550 RepID=I0I9R4_CALAS|nr:MULTISPECIES: deoxyguanosinetriphosphate triphosphohydrolase [Caldilinea]MBO9391500.1 deoxyguanosinetriphosphate triphosphohydrolase [Caldilinea sp.]BAM02002.1 deoxyguanosinetriphosphate triphosphohydrolase-like protein [Caldilinea aerophila DSM 14535 = NBRC 104270]GIV75201.1 MAG: deoxyguanosinetriphosphate triphosphohydrolase-like protein [Caldilinea sp.]